uniref:Reprolysin n=1 Tax=Rhipicephalus zambeziensis TaxID=60191 RepID=A0A224YQB1_9ACAR
MEYLAFARVVHMLCIIRSCQVAELPNHRVVVYPEVFDGRDEGTRVLKVNDDITLNLEPSSVLHENFFVRTYRNGVPEHQYYDVGALQKNFYHDERRLAAVILSEEGRAVKVEGVIGPNLKIRPLETTERSEYGRQAHVVELIEDDSPAEVYGKITESKLEIAERAARSGFDSSKFTVRVIYPEIFIVCDTWFQSGFRYNESLIIRYLMVTLQVVNLRYRTVRSPTVKLVFRGMEMSNWTQEREYYVYAGGDDIDAYKSLLNLVTFCKKRNETYGSFDLVYFTTGYDMVAMDDRQRLDSLAGYAFVASACTENRQQLGEDRAYSYKGIRITAHEVAHTLGCSHDGTSAPGVVKVFTPDSRRCPWDDGYIMSYKEDDFRSMQFSTCCAYDIAQMSWTYEAGCLHRIDSTKFPPYQNQTYRLPGDFLNITTQCRMAYPKLYNTYFMKEKGTYNCKAQCFVDGRQFNAGNASWPVLLIDGTPCLQEWGYRNHICINGMCVPDWREPRHGRRKPRHGKQ